MTPQIIVTGRDVLVALNIVFDLGIVGVCICRVAALNPAQYKWRYAFVYALLALLSIVDMLEPWAVPYKAQMMIEIFGNELSGWPSPVDVALSACLLALLLLQAQSWIGAPPAYMLRVQLSKKE